FVVDAGGDLCLSGHNANDEPWSVGIRHPRDGHGLVETLRVSDIAVCTSGDYQRRALPRDSDGAYDVDYHIVDPRIAASPRETASVTVLAPSAMVADALATTAFVLGPRDGIAFLECQGVSGLIIST